MFLSLQIGRFGIRRERCRGVTASAGTGNLCDGGNRADAWASTGITSSGAHADLLTNWMVSKVVLRFDSRKVTYDLVHQRSQVAPATRL
jgi:hypothetical protein